MEKMRWDDLLKEDQILKKDGDRRRYATDLYALRLFQKHVGWTPTLPSAVLCPSSAQELSNIVKRARATQTPIIPYGAGSGVLAGAECDDAHAVIVSTEKLNAVEEVDVCNQTVTVGAGVLIRDLEKQVNQQGYILGHYPQSMDLASMGGLVATRSIGQFSTLYGGIEDLLVGLEAVLPNGAILRIKPNPRKATGPDLRHLFLGAEGIFGIVTQVTVRVFPIPQAQWKQSYRVSTMREGFGLIRDIMQEGVRPAVVRLHDWLECEKPYSAFMEEDECLLLLLCEGSEEKVAYQQKVIERVIGDRVKVAGPKPVEIWYTHRNDAADEYEKYGEQGILVDTIEVSANWSDVADLYERVTERAYYSVPELIFFSGHSSHSYTNGTNIYFEMGALPMPGMSLEEIEKLHRSVWDIIEEETIKAGGAIAHHHGVGKHRVPYLKAELGEGHEVLTQIKRALDPDALLNPGTILPR